MEDLVIIGAGPAGYVAAIRAAQLGFKVTLIEKRKTMGGTCLNIGCIPSKALLQSSEHLSFFSEHGKEHGIVAKGIKANFKQMMKRKEEVVESLVTGVAGLLKRNKIQVVHGTACFVSPQEIKVDRKMIRAKNFLLATGSESVELPFMPFDEKVILSSTGALNFTKVPKKLIVIGAGVIGVELASVYNRLGSDVTIIEMLDRICPAMDNKIGKLLEQALIKQGLKFHLSAQVKEAKITKSGVSLSVKLNDKQEVFKADVVLVAVGRKPYTEGLGLEEIGVKTEKGFVTVDEYFRTSQPHILAIGDIVEGPMLAHRASEEGIAAVEWLAGQSSHINYMAIPNVIYTHPEVASVGLTEEEGKVMGLNLFFGSYPFKGNARARCSGEVDGMVKIVGDKATGRLLGVHIIGANASEMIGEGVIALEKHATVEELANASHAHPTLSESIKEAALNALGHAIHL